jgi:YtkA-like protein
MIMSIKTIVRAATGICLVATTPLHPLVAHAAAADYRFEVADVKPAGTGKSDVTLRLIHAAGKKPVANAVIFEIKADMGPEGMPTMTAPTKALPGPQPGLYVIEIEAGMAGTWALQVAAKVQGERETVRAALPVKLGQ